MKPSRSRSSSVRALPLLLLMLLGGVALWLGTVLPLRAAPVPTGKPAAYPAWWFQREVIPRTDPANFSPAHPSDYPPASDFAALNQGQLKQLATAAFDEMQAHLPRGSDAAVTALIKSWYVPDANGDFQHDADGRPIPAASTTNFAPVTNGQLKEVVHYFFDRLKAELYYPTNTPYPWAATGAVDHAVANIGQAKNLLRFDLTTDTDGDGMPDWWERAHGLNATDARDSRWISPGGGRTNYTSYRILMKLQMEFS